MIVVKMLHRNFRKCLLIVRVTSWMISGTIFQNLPKPRSVQQIWIVDLRTWLNGFAGWWWNFQESSCIEHRKQVSYAAGNTAVKHAVKNNILSKLGVSNIEFFYVAHKTYRPRRVAILAAVNCGRLDSVGKNVAPQKSRPFCSRLLYSSSEASVIRIGDGGASLLLGNGTSTSSTLGGCLAEAGAGVFALATVEMPLE